jgi:hypothetical protein
VSALLASVAAYTVLLTLLVACGEHLSKPAALSTALAAHRVVPAPSMIAALVIATEGLLGAAGVGALLGDGGRLLSAVLAGSAGLLAAYGSYGLYVRSTGRAVPCGCSRVELPMTGWVVARAFTLAGFALVGSLLSGSVVPVGRTGTQLTIVLLAAATFTALLMHLPAAMHDPTRDQPSARVIRGGVPG